MLDVIFREIQHRFHSLRIKREIGMLLGNLALEESAHDGMVEQGKIKTIFQGEVLVGTRRELELRNWPKIKLCCHYLEQKFY